ncbi:3'-5' exonuclease [Candidatus Gracilibacteria bacterium]|nr:3'-5' exonuclease [Candidatus Gracilibacteria bacterium]
MIICVWDTETTGFPVKDGKLEQQPYIIQFAAIVSELGADGTVREIERHDILIKPRVSIPFGASQVNGIYDRDVVDVPYIENSIDTIMKVLNSADIVVGHNVSFDEQILSYELDRLGRSGDYTPIQSICTMRTSTDYCKLPGRGFAWKSPKLSELHRFLFDEYFDGAHNALIDVEATGRSFFELVKRGVIRLEEKSVMRLF